MQNTGHARNHADGGIGNLGGSSEIRRLIRQRATSEQVLECAVGIGMTTVFDAALEHAVRGETTLEEVSRVSYAFT